MVRTGRVAESATAPLDGTDVAIAKTLRGSLQLRHVDAGSCNGCEIEIGTCFSPVYDGERYGVKLVASPRHADGLVVTGPVTQHMEVALKQTLEATPEPRVVIALGDCAINCGAFRDAHAVRGAVSDIVPVDVEIAGCPPEPAHILAALQRVVKP